MTSFMEIYIKLWQNAKRHEAYLYAEPRLACRTYKPFLMVKIAILSHGLIHNTKVILFL